MMPPIFHQILEEPLAVSGVALSLCAMLVFALPELLRQTENYLEVHRYYDELREKSVNVTFRGEILTTPGKSTNVAVIPLFWICHTIKNLKDHLVDNTTDIFSVIIMVQLCIIIASAGRSHDLWEALEHASTHVPLYELAALAVFNYVLWRMAAYWKVARELFQTRTLGG